MTSHATLLMAAAPWKRVGLGAAAVAAVGFGAWGVASGAFLGRSGDETPAARQAAAGAARAAEHAAFTSNFGERSARVVEISRGESLGMALSRAGAGWRDVNGVASALELVANPRRVRPGQELTLYFDGYGDQLTLSGLAFHAAPGETVSVGRSADGGFAARRIMMPLVYSMAHVQGEVTGSLYQAAIEAGATEQEVAQMADVFAYDVDFQRDVFPGDNFEFLFERYADDEGATVRTGELLFVSLESRRGEKAFYRFAPNGATTPQWYDAEGKTARRFLMKTPINGARLSSGFGMRRHPILGFSKMHKGADFAAPTGTPIMAAGDGVVEKASYFGAYGNYVRIRHSSDYKTAYAHLHRFARGMRPGARVEQGQVIGYVGSTGRSTGPHLHYEVIAKGVQINPMSMRVPTAHILAGAELDAFHAHRDRIDVMRAKGDAQAPMIAGEPAKPKRTEAAAELVRPAAFGPAGSP
jgi:murein DD-endopeptidase MepM/ murein hydrolase activator NlpD